MRIVNPCFRLCRSIGIGLFGVFEGKGKRRLDEGVSLGVSSAVEGHDPGVATSAFKEGGISTSVVEDFSCR